MGKHIFHPLTMRKVPNRGAMVKVPKCISIVVLVKGPSHQTIFSQLFFFNLGCYTVKKLVKELCCVAQYHTAIHKVSFTFKSGPILTDSNCSQHLIVKNIIMLKLNEKCNFLKC